MLQGVKTDIRFPNLGIFFSGVGNGITLFGIDVMYYGIIIVSGILLGVLLACFRAKPSPSCTTYSFPSERTSPFSFAALKLPHPTKLS